MNGVNIIVVIVRDSEDTFDLIRRIDYVTRFLIMSFVDAFVAFTYLFVFFKISKP